MPILVCNIGWMSRYDGIDGKPDKIVGGGKYVDKSGHGHEACNFTRCADGIVYGHVESIKGEVDRNIQIEALGAEPGQDFIDGVDVVWTATNPLTAGRYVVGWYRNARVFRTRQYFDRLPSMQHKRDGIDSFRIRAKSSDSSLLSLDEREIRLGKGKGWIGHTPWWFPEVSENSEVRKFLLEITTAMAGEGATLSDRTSRRPKWGHGGGDVSRKAEVEFAAIRCVTEYLVKRKFRVRSVEEDNKGWDLEAASSGGAALKIEVKGLSGSSPLVGLTPNEFRALRRHLLGKFAEYRLCIVTEALESPQLRFLRFNTKTSLWDDEVLSQVVSVQLKEIVSASVVVEE